MYRAKSYWLQMNGKIFLAMILVFNLEKHIFYLYINNILWTDKHNQCKIYYLLVVIYTAWMFDRHISKNIFVL